MTTRFTKVAGALWRSPRFIALPDKAKLLMLYLITSDHQTSAGCYRLPQAYAAADLRWSVKAYQTALQHLVDAGLILFDADTETIYIDKWFRHSPPMNPKHALSITRIIGEIVPDAIREKVEADYREAETNKNPIPDPSSFPVSGALRDQFRSLNGGRR